MALTDKPWTTSFPAEQDTVGLEQPNLANDSAPGAHDGDRVLVSHVQALRDKAQALALKVGDDSGLPEGSLLQVLEDLATRDWKDVYVARAAERTGIPPEQLGYLAEDFFEFTRWYKVMGTAEMEGVEASTGGVVEIVVGAGDEVVYQNGDAVRGSPSIIKGDGKFYFMGRLKLPSYPSGGVITLGCRSGTPHVIGLGTQDVLGVPYFAGYTYKFGASIPEYVLSSHAVDDSWHVFEMWSDGTTYKFSVDDEGPLTIPVVNRPTDYMYAHIDVVEMVTMRLDQLLFAFPQAA